MHERYNFLTLNSQETMLKKNLTPPRSFITQAMREAQHGHRGAMFWFTGLSGAGKSTLAHAMEKAFFEAGRQVVVLDGDVIRHGLCSDLSFSPEGRAENIRRIAELGNVFIKQGIICLCAFISPLRAHRDIVRAVIQDGFYEIYVSCSLETCEHRDVKGYYKLAREGKIKNYTGISAPYEIPENPDFIIDTDSASEHMCVEKLRAFIESKICRSGADTGKLSSP